MTHSMQEQMNEESPCGYVALLLVKQTAERGEWQKKTMRVVERLAGVGTGIADLGNMSHDRYQGRFRWLHLLVHGLNTLLSPVTALLHG